MIIPVVGLNFGEADPEAIVLGKTHYDRVKVIAYGHRWHYDEYGRNSYTIRFEWVWGYMKTITVALDPQQPAVTTDFEVFVKGVLGKSKPIVLTGDELAELNLEGRVGEYWHDMCARVIYTFIVNNAAALIGASKLVSGTVEEA